MIFTEMTTAPAGTRPAWFDFEKDCLTILEKRGLRVIHQAANRDGDGGVDLYATAPDGACWVIQCKCWAAHRKVGPEVVRELAGAIQLAAKGATEAARGMLITTSSFTSGAVESALALGYELIDGQQFASLAAAE
jgi:HJR/Mrr/RecB family endonuclease